MHFLLFLVSPLPPKKKSSKSPWWDLTQTCRERERERERESERGREGGREGERVKVNAIGLFTPPKMNTGCPQKREHFWMNFLLSNHQFSGNVNVQYIPIFFTNSGFFHMSTPGLKHYLFTRFYPCPFNKNDPTDTSINSSGVPPFPKVASGFRIDCILERILWMSNNTPSSRSKKSMLHLQYNLGQSRTN